MKKITLGFMFVLCLFTTVSAAEVVKIQYNGQFKSESSIEFTLPELNSNDFIIDSLEIAVFQKADAAAQWSVFEQKMINDVTSLNIAFQFSPEKYQPRTKYKLAYRYHTRSIADPSIYQIAGAETKDGWRLVGEANPTVATTNGLSFYLNEPPTITMGSITYTVDTGLAVDTNGKRQMTYTTGKYLPSNALVNGLTVNLTTGDYNSEDTLEIGYILKNKATGAQIAASTMPAASSFVLTNSTTASSLELVVYVVDNYGARTDCAPVTLNLDKEAPKITGQLDTGGRAIKGRNLYSKFSFSDNIGMGEVYYTLKNKTGQVKITNGIVDVANLDDGAYEVVLEVFDAALNKTTYSYFQTLDNTPPTLRLVPSTEDSRAYPYKQWLNVSKNIVVQTSDNISLIKSIKGDSFYSSSGAGTHVMTLPNTTGKIPFTITAEDNAVEIDKATNKIKTTSAGNISTMSNEVWLDKTAPTITINATNQWYTPTNITVDVTDLESVAGRGDNSGVFAVMYNVTDSITPSDVWNSYTSSGVGFNTGGIWYLHVKAIDIAGNTVTQSQIIKIHIPPEIKSDIAPASTHLHTVYNTVNAGQYKVYITKGTAYNCKYTFRVECLDTNDTLNTTIKLVNEDNSDIGRTVSVSTPPNGSTMRDIFFDLSYTDQLNQPLPDGVYSIYVTLEAVKHDGTVLTAYFEHKGCEVAIKRNSPPKPIINVLSNSVEIDYPQETLSNSLNRDYIKGAAKREYKQISGSDTNLYIPYTTSLPLIDSVVTALYTDCAGNISTASQRIFAGSSGGGGGGDGDGGRDITTPGNAVSTEESRAANVYYINTRRQGSSDLDVSIFSFITD